MGASRKHLHLWCCMWRLHQTGPSCWIWHEWMVCGPDLDWSQIQHAGMVWHRYCMQCAPQTEPVCSVCTGSSPCAMFSPCQIGFMCLMQCWQLRPACAGPWPAGSTVGQVIRICGLYLWQSWKPLSSCAHTKDSNRQLQVKDNREGQNREAEAKTLSWGRQSWMWCTTWEPLLSVGKTWKWGTWCQPTILASYTLLPNGSANDWHKGTSVPC